MTAESTTKRRFGSTRAVGLIAAGVIAGGVAATAIAATAATTPSPAASGSSESGRPAGAPHGRPDGPGGRGSAPVRSDEKSVSAADAATIKAAALKAVPGGTIYRIETDAGDGAYEAHMTKADGSEVTVKLDKSFAVTKVETGMGTGDPATAGH